MDFAPTSAARQAGRVRKGLLLLGALAASVLGWGYWHASSHGTINVAVYDVSLKTDKQAYGQVPRAELAFTDAGGTVLARARADEPFGVVSIPHPQVGDCRGEERGATAGEAAAEAWRRCFETQSRWLMGWVRKTRYAVVKRDACTIDRVPVSIYESMQDWWLWWVPLPHVGGRPYTYFSLTLWIDGRNCRASAAPR